MVFLMLWISDSISFKVCKFISYNIPYVVVSHERVSFNLDKAERAVLKLLKENQIEVYYSSEYKEKNFRLKVLILDEKKENGIILFEPYFDSKNKETYTCLIKYSFLKGAFLGFKKLLSNESFQKLIVEAVINYFTKRKGGK